MKIIRTYQNGYADIQAESPREAFAEKGDYIEFDYEDYQIIDYEYRGGKPVYSCRRV